MAGTTKFQLTEALLQAFGDRDDPYWDSPYPPVNESRVTQVAYCLVLGYKETLASLLKCLRYEPPR